MTHGVLLSVLFISVITAATGVFVLVDRNGSFEDAVQPEPFLARVASPDSGKNNEEHEEKQMPVKKEVQRQQLVSVGQSPVRKDPIIVPDSEPEVFVVNEPSKPAQEQQTPNLLPEQPLPPVAEGVQEEVFDDVQTEVVQEQKKELPQDEQPLEEIEEVQPPIVEEPVLQEQEEETPIQIQEQQPFIELLQPININSASFEELQAITGVGPVIAQRIIDYRNAKGLFVTIEDIKRVSGIGDITFEKMKEEITAGNISQVLSEPEEIPALQTPRLININTAPFEELQAITGVGKVIAQRIIEHREYMGLFVTIEEIMNVKGIGNATFEKMKQEITAE